MIRNDVHMKTIVNFGIDNYFNIFVIRNKIIMFLLFAPSWKPLEVGRPWNASWMQWGKISSAYCFIEIAVIVTQVD